MSIKHHLHFSIDYLRRQNLLSTNGVPVHFAGLVGHLYFTENAIFAFHSLLRGGSFHKLCKDLDCARERVLREMMLVPSHLFSRILVQWTAKFLEVVERSSDICLKRLPAAAEQLLARHNRETLLSLKDYVLTSDPPPVIQSPFVALSGFMDEFDSIKGMCSTVRDGVFLEESAIPHLQVWPHDTSVELNAYLYDLLKYGSLKILVHDTPIKRSDVWLHLKDFSLVLNAIVTSLKGVLDPGGGFYMEDLDGDDDMSGMSEGYDEATSKVVEVQKPAEESDKIAQALAKNKVKSEVPDIWDEWSDASASESEESVPGSDLV
ncbi:uncharacterized protein FFFS_15914 [Fusarium fujikuroi]|nr:uncharacterized protein FFFS_15914 [Fusarium fujikuroi]